MNRLTASLSSPVRKLRSVPTDNTAADMSLSGRALNDDATRSATASISKSAIESLILKHYTGLRLLILRRTGDENVAADLLSEAICITWEKWQAHQIERPDQIAGYIFQVAVNLLRNHRRTIGDRPQSRADTVELDKLADEESSRDNWIEKQIAAKVKRLIQSMSTPRDRLILTKFYLDEEDKESICRELELDALQFDKVLHRARGRLRELLEAHGLRRSDVFCALLVM